uniref:Uncharacterized protein n=1 Tax=Anguilla anguilla TaxID=7936 RepID=A0A0E9WTG9_ANGAN
MQEISRQAQHLQETRSPAVCSQSGTLSVSCLYELLVTTVRMDVTFTETNFLRVLMYCVFKMCLHFCSCVYLFFFLQRGDGH